MSFFHNRLLLVKTPPPLGGGVKKAFSFEYVTKLLLIC